jgi:putative glutamine amidotransferase
LNIVEFMKKRPVIGITMRLEIESNRFYLGRDYSEALAGLGAVPFHMSLIPDREYIGEIMRLVDGVLLPGSDTDVDPLRYGSEPHPRLKKTIALKDDTDLLVLEHVERTAMPLLAICYGMQALNVSRGGTLVQDIESEIDECLRHEQGIPLERNSHSLMIAPDSRLKGLAETATVNSHHHQAVRNVGRDLRATAWAKDGVIECIEDTRGERFALGVQWHPELSWKTDDLSRKIFEELIGACVGK